MEIMLPNLGQSRYPDMKGLHAPAAPCFMKHAIYSAAVIVED